MAENIPQPVDPQNNDVPQNDGFVPILEYKNNRIITVLPGNSSDVISLHDKTVYNLCGSPGICKVAAAAKCKNLSLSSCSECSHVTFGFFIFIILLLGLAILMGNLLILKVNYDLKKKQKTNKLDIYKTSLAVADLLSGKCFYESIY